MTNSNVSADIYEKAAAFTTDKIATIVQITDGAINETYLVETLGGRFVLQKMNKIFSPVVMGNLALIQPYVTNAGVLVPHGLDTIDGNPYVLNGGEYWYRALKFVPGKTIHDHVAVSQAESAAALVGAFHSALAPCEADLAVALPNFHDTPHYMDQLKEVMWANTDEEKTKTLEPLATQVLKLYEETYVDLSALPQRIIHADLKISNVLFSDEGEAIALIDMDTLMRGSVVVEMGDALRSWCGVAGEDSVNQVFNEEIAINAIESYREAAIGVTAEEIKLIPYGIRLLTLELAARFVTDAYNEDYFALSTKYDSLYEQNKTRAENQLHFLTAYEAKRNLLEKVV